MIEIGTNGPNALVPIPACTRSTPTTSSVA